MAVSEQNGRPLKEVFSKSKKEYEEDTRRDTLDFWPGMEVYLDSDDIAFSDWTAIVFKEETTIKPLEKGTTLKSFETGPNMSPFERGYTKRPLEKEATPKLFDKKPSFRTPEIWHPFNNLHPSKPSVKWPSIAPEHLPPIKPIKQWKLEDTHVNWDWDLPKYNYKFVFEHPTLPPVTSAAHTGAVVMKLTGGAVGFFFALLIISTLLDKKHRRRGVVVAAAAADQEMLTAWRPSDAGALETFKSDLPPPYECVLYSMNNCVGEVPPPYTYPEDGAPQDHKPRQDVFFENELKTCSEDGALDIRTELVFDNGRIVERLSLDLNSNNNETGALSNNNVEDQSIGQGDIKDTVVYVDETGHVKGNTQ